MPKYSFWIGFYFDQIYHRVINTFILILYLNPIINTLDVSLPKNKFIR